MTIAGQTPPAKIEPFDAIAEEYDSRFTNSLIGRAQRESVWLEMDRLFRPGQRILDINCGTGVDAMHLTARGIHVVACDASPEMVAVARRRQVASAIRNHADIRVLAIEQIGQLEKEGLRDGVISNFAGLNCVADLRSVARDLARLVKPGGRVILCLFGRFCLWEMLWYILQGDVKKAFRRLRGKGVTANLAPGHSVFVRYPSVPSLRRDFAAHFRLVSWKGTGVAVPPSYLEPWAVRFARLFTFAAKIDPFLGRCPGFRALADHVVVIFERVEV
jgi:ubiquinone/menaquinone biosynthesis C-methylase UbiE